MEIDMQPTSSIYQLTYTGVGQKRSRSLEEDEMPAVRPSKRANMALSNVNSHSFSEDWVCRTRGLSIHTPVASSSPTSSTEDVAMGEEPTGQPMPNLLFLGQQQVPQPAPMSMRNVPQQQQQPTSFPQTPQPPSIALQPATPTVNRIAHDFSMDQTPASPKKLSRFTMGPRIDCIKCRQGVKGHYSHID
ncbi:hypothetical protein CYLTODRAFT_395175 [Cylindrobasidium torrendii FP15055 ss-10]|uniref:Uncharacterized protein n=1 Tax=Cylindrobasidium torrendii FP15055 ss-10 TaxID=1314674 RepID=A0A0D7BES8_9AGAR|nr:hypothetical protein CYLTODRAFT_395175 [Cylindrobasidium torrendii FP15055 ss-10]